MTERRLEKDSLGAVSLPAEALYGAQTQRAVENFPISSWRFPRVFLYALGAIKWASAVVNQQLGELDEAVAEAVAAGAEEVRDGRHDHHFPVDVFQTGSGTSTNMNANEVIAHLASVRLGKVVHPNNHVNLGQSSNDVIPSAIHLSAYRQTATELLPALRYLQKSIEAKAQTLEGVIKTGRTHLMDAVPLRMSQEMGGWAVQIADCRERIDSCLPRLARLALGGTAIGTGINAHPEFGASVARVLADETGLPLVAAANRFAVISSQDTAVELSGHLRTTAVALLKICNDLRWMNSGPVSGLGEISLAALQPGSSIMPGKVNPVIPEAVAMVCAQVIGNDVTITVAGQSGSFQLNVMLPVIAHNLLQSLELLSRSLPLLADQAVRTFTVNEARVQGALSRNAILATALNPVIGYDLAAKITRRAQEEDRPILEVAEEMTDLGRAELRTLLDPESMV